MSMVWSHVPVEKVAGGQAKYAGKSPELEVLDPVASEIVIQIVAVLCTSIDQRIRYFIATVKLVVALQWWKDELKTGDATVTLWIGRHAFWTSWS